MKRISLTLLVLSLSLTLTAIDRANAGGESQSPKVENLKGNYYQIDFPENNKDPRLQTVPLDGVQRRGAARQAPMMIDERVFEKIAPAGANNPCPKFFDWIPNPMGNCREWRESFIVEAEYRYPDSEVLNTYACRFNREEYSEWLGPNGSCPENFQMEIHDFGFNCVGRSNRPPVQHELERCPGGQTPVIFFKHVTVPPYYVYSYECSPFPPYGNGDEICGGRAKKTTSPRNDAQRNILVGIDFRPDDSVGSYCCATIGPQGE